MKRYLVALGAASLVGTVVLGSAAALGVDGGVVQAGNDTNLVCQTDTVSVIQRNEFDSTLEPYSIGPRIQNVSSDCAGEFITVHAFDENGTQLREWTGTVPAGGGTVDGSWANVPLSDIYSLTVGIVS